MLDETFLDRTREAEGFKGRDFTTEARGWLSHVLGWNPRSMRISRVQGLDATHRLVETPGEAALVDLGRPHAPTVMRIPGQMELQQQEQLLAAYVAGARTDGSNFAAERSANRNASRG